MSQEYTYQDVAEHNTKKDMFVVIHDKVYDATKFIDEHPYVPGPAPPILCYAVLRTLLLTCFCHPGAAKRFS